MLSREQHKYLKNDNDKYNDIDLEEDGDVTWEESATQLSVLV